MAQHHYAFQSYDQEHMARAVGRDLAISTKKSIELCAFLRRKNVHKAKSILQDVITKKLAIPFKYFMGGASHRPGNMAGGKYPISTATAILGVLENAEANAQQKGLSTANLHIVHICAQKAAEPYHAGRFRGRKMKRSHVEVVLVEQQETKARRASGRDAKKSVTAEATP